MSPTIRSVETKADRKAFVNLAWDIYANDPNWVPPLKDEVMGLITPGKNPWFGHAEARFFLAERGGKGRRTHLGAGRPTRPGDAAGSGGGPETGHWGMLEAKDQETARALITAAEAWLRDRGMRTAMGPFSLSVWDEPRRAGERVRPSAHGDDGSPSRKLSPLDRGGRLSRREGSLHLSGEDRQRVPAARPSASSPPASATRASGCARWTSPASPRRRR